MEHKTVRVRFAPSPTGHLHVGGLRTALFNYLFAKHNNGVYLLRCEDTDLERSTEAFFDSQMRSFKWVGIIPDEPVVIQSTRFAQHFKVIDSLIERKKAYKCYCTEQVLAARLGKTDENDFIRYDRHCFYNQTAHDEKDPFVIRFCMPESLSEYSFDDLIRGQISFSPEQYDDFIIVRTDGVPVYNFVVVVDDAFMAITHVIRGEEHIANTPKQIAIYNACGYKVPFFAHLPMILGASGAKLSKRDGATSVNDYKEHGYLPEALVNYLAKLGWAYKDQEIFSMQELITHFSLEGVGKKGSIFDPEKLNWMNGLYIKNMSARTLYEYMCTELEYKFGELLPGWSQERIEKAIDVFKGRVITLEELKNELCTLRGQGNVLIPEFTKEMKQYVAMVRERFLKEGISANTIKEVAKEADVPIVLVAQPVRLALIGKLHGPGIGDLIHLLTTQEVLERLKKLEDVPFI